MTWKDISVFQYQQIFEINAMELDDLDKTIKMAAIVTNQTEQHIRSLSVVDFNKIVQELDFLNQKIEFKKVDVIKVNGKRYKCNYDVKGMSTGRYIETKFFLPDFEANIHKIAASMVIPMKKTFLKWELDTYNADHHDDYAADLQAASIEDVMGSLVFFYLKFRRWMKDSVDYSIKELTKKGMKKKTLNQVCHHLFGTLDGYIRQHLLQNMKESDLKMSMN